MLSIHFAGVLMISPAALRCIKRLKEKKRKLGHVMLVIASRVGVGGRLVVFFKAVALHFAVAPSAAPTAPTAPRVLAKCAPVLTLMALVLLHRNNAPNKQRRSYCVLVSVGLALSACGDALLEWEPLLQPGMACFAAAHLAYLAAFRTEGGGDGLNGGHRGGRSRGWGEGVAGVLIYGATALYLQLLQPQGALKVLVPLYSVVLSTMAWRGVCGWLRGGRGGGPAAAGGGVLFLVSDAVLGLSLFGGGPPLPHSQELVMSTYYLAQLGLALSALLDSPTPTPTHTACLAGGKAL